MRILVAEDDPVLGEALCFAIKLSNHAVDWVPHGAAADESLLGGEFDLLILDLGLPKIDGFEVLKRLRARGSSMPVLILSGRGNPQEKVRGLDLGADDYLVKPFSLEELQARVRALLRRGRCGSPTEIHRAGLRFDTNTRTTSLEGRPLALSPKEVAIFELLFSNFGRIVSKQQLLQRLYNFEEAAGENAIEVYVHRLRKKLEGSLVTVRTMHGRGYQLDYREPH